MTAKSDIAHLTQPHGQQTYDSPWKTMLTRHFEACLAFYFPHAHQQIDWQEPTVFLDKELAKLLRDDEGGTLRVDKLARVQLRNGQEGWVLLHIEVQSQRESNFAERLYRYNSRIYNSRGAPVATFIILCDDAPSWRPTHFHYELLGFEIRLDFPTIKLLDYQQQADALAQDSNPFALVTLAHLNALSTKPDDPARQIAKLRLVRLLYQRGYRRQEVVSLFNFIDWVLVLTPELEEIFDAGLDALEKETKMEYVSSRERRALARGHEEGLTKGFIEGQHQMLLRWLGQRFGHIPFELVTQIQQITDESVLDDIREQILQAESLEDIVIPGE